MLKIENISVGYSNNNTVLKDLSFAINNKEIVCVMGESGSGKSTLLKAIYGLLDLNNGQINWDNNPITGPKENLIPGVEEFKYVPQNFDLMPYISTSENIGKYLSRFDVKRREDTIKNMLDVLELTSYASEKVINLSGGQQQRVAIARALATEPKLLLLDEPFGQIDTFRKNNLRRNLFTSLKEQNIPCIIATHDGEDALSFADRLIILKDGKIVINMNPREFYKNPKDKYAAALLDDINEIIIEDKTYLLYPDQLKIVNKSTLVAKVLKSYYRGSNWLIECFYNKKRIFINHSKEMETNTEVFFKFKGKPKHL